jgi:lysozyme family protein
MRGDQQLTDLAIAHYETNYWDRVRGDEIQWQDVAEEVFDTAVNCGIGTALKLLDEILNVGNRNGQDYADIQVDGKFSDQDMQNLGILVEKRGVSSVVKCLNILQGARYYEICKANPKMERYWWGWCINRA